MTKIKTSFLIYAVAIVAVLLAVIAILISSASKTPEKSGVEAKIEQRIIQKSDHTYDGELIEEVRFITVHYTANPGSTAIANRNYFNGLADGHGVSASAHFIIGLEGEIIQCVPLECVSWANGNMDSNRHSITIECCHPTDDGHFSEATLSSLRELVAWLCEKYSVGRDGIIRHYDVTGKDCPRYFVAHPDEWEAFKDSVFEK